MTDSTLANTVIDFRKAISLAISAEMERDSTVILLGEDIKIRRVVYFRLRRDSSTSSALSAS